jgi:predicted PurR-regulated permease PerM
MMDVYFKKITAAILLLALLLLSFFLIKPIILSVIIGVILAFIFEPAYKWFLKITKRKSLSAMIVCAILILLLVIPFWFLIPVFIDQAVKFYTASQQMDFISPIKSFFPLLASETFAEEVSSILSNFATKITNAIVNTLSDIILNLPNLLLQLAVVLFSFYFILKDKDQLFAYFRSLMPFSKEVEDKLLASTKGITVAVIYGQVIVGVIQGIIAGLGFFIFGVPNALLLTFIAALAGIFPIIGTVIIWVPVALYLLLTGNIFAAVGVIIFGSISSIADNFIRPIIVSRKSKIHPAILLIGMIGGLFMFGFLGFILGPLIIAYFLIFLEVYRDKKVKGILLQKDEGPDKTNLVQKFLKEKKETS